MTLEIYQPTPIDTRGVSLPPEIERLLEKLAENVHDEWARKRLAEGWCVGVERNDTLKTHPCLVPYEQLPEAEKQYDRDTAAQTLKAILGLGYTIHPPTS